MSTDSSPAFNLEHLKKDAKRLLRACRAGDAGSIRTVQFALSGLKGLDSSAVAQTIQLADVHQAMAMQRGFASWADLTRFGDPLGRLLTAVRGGHLAVLRRDLPQYRDLGISNVFAAAAVGLAPALQLHIDREPAGATSSRDGWTALDYVCSSPLGRLSTRHAASLIDCAEILLAAGADPGSSVEDGRLPGSAFSATMRATLGGNMGLVVVLKRAGAAEPQQELRAWAEAHRTPDSATLHHVFGEYFRRPDVRAQMQTSFEAFRAQRGATSDLTPIAVPSDPHDLQHMRMPNMFNAPAHLWEALLDGGYDPTAIGANGRSALHGLMTYAPPPLVEMFLSRGVDMRGKDADGRSLIASAVRAGNVEVVNLLRARGVADDSTLADRLIGWCLADDAEAAQALVAEHPEVMDTLTRGDADEFVRAAARGAVGQVRLMLACGIPADIVDESGATALHQAAWRGQVPIVELLLAQGASPVLRDELYGETALDWARHGAAHARGAEGPCLEVARRLEAASALT